MPSKYLLKVYKGLQKGYSLVLMQIRIERIGLNYFLYKIEIMELD